MYKPLISVIVPVYKAESTLERCVKSILAQTVSDLELILVDDGSPDNSGALCDEIAKNDPRVRVFHKENGGAASARNLGVDNLRGEFVSFVDSDDYIAPDMYEKMLPVLREHVLPYLDSGRIIVKQNAAEQKMNSDTLSVISGEEAIGRLLDWSGNCSLCTHVFRAEVFRDGFRIPEGRRVEDFIFCIRLFDRFQQEAYYDHAFYYVVQHAGSVTQSGGGSIFLDALYYADEAETLVAEKYPALSEKCAFFRFYCIGQLLINAKPPEFRTGSEEIGRHVGYLWRHISAFLKNRYLSKKYKLILLTACIHRRLPSILYRANK